MTFRTIEQIVYAANASRDLENLVMTYLKLWRKYANGRNGVTIPDTNSMTVRFDKQLNESMLCVRITEVGTNTYQTPEYYDVDDDNFTDGYSSDANICGYTTHRVPFCKDRCINIPFSSLLVSEQGMISSIKSYVIKDDAETAEKNRQAEIAEYEEKLTKLRAK